MQTHDDDNIPVLEDVIHEEDILEPDAPLTNEKQKTLWDVDSDGGDITVTSAAVATTDACVRGYTWDEQVDESSVTLNEDDSTSEIADFMDAGPAEEPAARLQHDASDDISGNADDVAEDSLDVIETYTDDPVYDQADARPDETLPPLAKHIDIDRLAEQILLRLMPDLEDYLLERIHRALETALHGKHRD